MSKLHASLDVSRPPGRQDNVVAVKSNNVHHMQTTRKEEHLVREEQLL
jgi:hypothetical protein